MRIAFFILSLREHGGGSHQNAQTLIRGLRAEGHEVDVHVMLKHGTPPLDIAVHAERGEGLSMPRLQRRCAEAMRTNEGRTDIFLVYGQALVWGAGMYRVSGGEKPVVVYLDSHLDSMKEAYRQVGFFQRLKHHLWGKGYGLLLARAVDAYAAVSPYLVERYVRFGFPKRAFTVIPNAFSFSAVQPAVRVVRPELRLLYVGRLSHEKGADMLLDALAGTPKGSWRLRVIGEGEERDMLEKEIASLGLSQHIDILPWMSQEELEKEYQEADVLVAPSRVPEPFGRVIVEAMHEGLPVIVPSRGGAAWVAGDAGTTFESGNAASLRHALASLQDTERRLEVGGKGKARAAAFSVEQVGKDLAQLLASHTQATGAHSMTRTLASVLRIGRFLISGGLATAANLLALYVLVHQLGIWYLTSSIIAFFVGFVVSFTLQKFWTFQDTRTHVIGSQLVAYFAIVLVNLGLNTALVYVFVEYAHFWPLIAQALASLIIAAEGFFAYKIFVFR